MRKIKIISNPTAGKIRRGGSRTAPTEIIDGLREKNIAFETAFTSFPGEAKILAKEAARDKSLDLLLAIGGDGTVNEVINGLVNSNLPFGIIPAGSLNCVAREIGLSSNPRNALSQLLNGDVKTVHLGKISFLDKNPERYFLIMAGIGLDAMAVVNLNHKLKKLIGPLAYVWSGAKQIFRNMSAIKIDANQKTISGYSCIINKLKTYAWFNFAPETGIEKDFFQMFLYTKNDVLSLIRYGIGGVFGWHRRFRDVESCLLKNVKITSNETVYIQADGEAVGTLPVEISIVPNAIKILLPKCQNFQKQID